MSPAAYVSASECGDAMTQSAMNECVLKEYKASDKTLNQTYREVFKHTEGDQRKLLKAAQNAWIGYRDSDCKFQSYRSGEGAVRPMNMALCLKEKTIQRTTELKKMLDCPEGDVSCPI